MTDWREEKAKVAAALDQLLPALPHPHLAVPLAFRLAPLVGMTEARIRTVLGWLAKDGHPHATHDGGEVKSYGRTVTRWRWHPQPQRLSIDDIAALERKRALAGKIDLAAMLGVDTDDW